MVDSRLLDEQLDYYRERAAEYDQWWERRSRYDRGPEANAQWRTEISQVRAAFDTLPLSGDVLELAPGTGYWTELLAHQARRVTALDGSSEMMAINQTCLVELSRSVDCHQVNLFDWKPTRRWDGLVFCFWISHVPRDRLAGFLATCRDALVEGATVFFLDGQRINESTAVDHVLADKANEVMVRKLNDGREFRIVKNFHEPVELTELAGAAGFNLEVHRTDNLFQFGVGVAR